MNEQLMEEALSPENWHTAWKAVVANRGAAGVDGMKCEELVPLLKQHGEKIRAKLLAGTYVPNAVKRVTIPKPGGGERHLGICFAPPHGAHPFGAAYGWLPRPSVPRF